MTLVSVANCFPAFMDSPLVIDAIVVALFSSMAVYANP